MDQSNDAPEPNIVLRGGPFDGRRMHADNLEPITLRVEGERFVYRPTPELDTEFPTLAMWVFSHTEAA
jgi:hypothetical protein